MRAALTRSVALPSAGCAMAAALVLICFSGQRAHAQEPGPGPEGNWLIEWHNYPKGQITRAAAVLSRRWEQVCVEVSGGGCRFVNQRTPSDSTWSLNYTVYPYEHHGGPQELIVGRSGQLTIEWGYGVLGGWGGRSELRQTGPNEIRGTWGYAPDSTGGLEIWRRAIPAVDSVVFKGVTHYSYSMENYDDSTAQMIAVGTARGKLGRVEAIYGSGRGWGPGNDMRGNRPKFRVEIYGQNLWGHHLIDVAGALDLEPLPGWRRYLFKDGSGSTAWNNPTQVAGIEADVVIWANAMPGEKELRIDDISVLFDFVVHGHPGGTTVSEVSQATQSKPSKAIPLLIGGAVAGVALANGVMRRRRRQPGPLPAADLKSDIDAVKDEFERLQQALRERVARELADIAEFDRQFNEKWAAAMQSLDEYIKLYPKLLPGLTALMEQQGSRELARKVAEWVDTAYSSASLGFGVARGVLGTARKAGTQAAKQADDLFPQIGAQPKRRKPRSASNVKAQPSAPKDRPLSDALKATVAPDPARAARKKARDELMEIVNGEPFEPVGAVVPRGNMQVNAAAEALGMGGRNCVSCSMALDQRLAAEAAGIPPAKLSQALPTPGVLPDDAFEMLRRRYGRVPGPEGRSALQRGHDPVHQVIQPLVKPNPANPGKPLPLPPDQAREVIEKAIASDDGARGIVLVRRTIDGRVSQHAFNVVNRRGHVFFVDAQSGSIWTQDDWAHVLETAWVRTDRLEVFE